MTELTYPAVTRAAKQEEAISVCAWMLYPQGRAPGQRYRIEQWQPHLERENIKVDYFPFADDRLMERLYQPGRTVAKAAGIVAAFARRIRDLLHVRRYDVIYLYRAAGMIGPAALEVILDVLGRPIVLDFDDAIYLTHTAEANKKLGWLKWSGKTAALCRWSDHVVVGSSILAEYARTYNLQVTVIPSSVDTTRYRPRAQRHAGDQIVVGWTGSSTSQTYLEEFAPVLRELLPRHRVELRVHSDREPRLTGVPFVWRPWSAQTEVEELSQFDIGLMPMPDNPWARGKCAMKALLYMALGIPVVCSAVGVNCEVIQHGINGLLARTRHDWLHHLQSLIGDPVLRERLGAAGRATVEEQYSMDCCAARFANVIRRVANTKSPTLT